MSRGGSEGWAPAEYLELVPQTQPAPPSRPAVGAKPKPAPAPKPSERPSWSPADAAAAPVAVMPGMGDPGGFAAVLARKKAEAAGNAGGQPPSGQ